MGIAFKTSIHGDRFRQKSNLKFAESKYKTAYYKLRNNRWFA
jgi:hypothetical protein